MANYPEAHDDTHDLVPGEEQVDGYDIAQGIFGYVLGLVFASGLTVASFYVAGSQLIWGAGIPVALIVLAIAQMGVHLVFFLHISTSPDSANNILALAFGVLLVALVFIGSVWIMAHLNANLMPMSQVMQMQR
ncbi:MAG: cytochrome o ubiquinol oxidase subunit IV [Rhodopila sp.]|nr:cytochrome o ubiquinol oxidase subunit IV [Rhodopila sp.]